MTDITAVWSEQLDSADRLLKLSATLDHDSEGAKELRAYADRIIGVVGDDIDALRNTERVQESINRHETDLTAQLAAAMYEAEAEYMNNIQGWSLLGWDRASELNRETSMIAATAALNLLTTAGRLIPEGGTALTAEQIEDVQLVLGELERGGPAFEAAHDRLRARFPATEPAEEAPNLAAVAHEPRRFDPADECQNDNHDPGCVCGARHWMSTPAPAVPAEEETKAEEYRSVIHSHRTIKTVGEALSCAEAALLNAYPNSGLGAHYAEVIAELLRDVARQRPVGSNGKHGELHTPTCGCEDVPSSSPVVPAPTETGPWPTVKSDG